MKKIIKILKKKKLTLKEVKEIEQIWRELDYRIKANDAGEFYILSKTHLGRLKIKIIEKINFSSRTKFEYAFSTIKEKQILLSKLNLVSLIKIKLTKEDRTNKLYTRFDYKISELISILKDERDFIREIILYTRPSIRRIAVETIPEELERLNIEILGK
jgi:hypothetical protein